MENKDSKEKSITVAQVRNNGLGVTAELERSGFIWSALWRGG